MRRGALPNLDQLCVGPRRVESNNIIAASIRNQQSAEAIETHAARLVQQPVLDAAALANRADERLEFARLHIKVAHDVEGRVADQQRVLGVANAVPLLVPCRLGRGLVGGLLVGARALRLVECGALCLGIIAGLVHRLECRRFLTAAVTLL